MRLDYLPGGLTSSLDDLDNEVVEWLRRLGIEVTPVAWSDAIPATGSSLGEAYRQHDPGSPAPLDTRPPPVLVARGFAHCRALADDGGQPFISVVTSQEVAALTDGDNGATHSVLGSSNLVVVTDDSLDAVITALSNDAKRVWVLGSSSPVAESSFADLERFGISFPPAFAIAWATAKVRFIDFTAQSDAATDGGEQESTSSRSWDLGEANGWSTVDAEGVPIAVLAPKRGSRWRKDSNGRRMWRLRRVRDLWPIHAILTDDLNLAEYAASHDDLAALTWLSTVDHAARQSWTSSEWTRFESLALRIGGVTTTPKLRNDIELRVPRLIGRVTVAPPSGSTLPRVAAAASIQRYGVQVRPTLAARAVKRVLLVTHDDKFSVELVRHLRRQDDVEIVIDAWESQHTTPHPSTSRAHLSDADVVWVEYASGAAEWYSRNVDLQRLVVRVHGYEVQGPWAGDINFQRVDLVVFPSELTRQQGIALWGLDPDGTAVIPNAVDARHLHRPKSASAAHTLGLLGWTPSLKRVDRAVALLERLLAADPRFTLSIKGRLPQETPWIWAATEERHHFEGVFHALRRSPSLQSRVSFEEHDADVAGWLTGIGWVLSPSNRESFHLAPVEGMASGAVPVVWDRPGASAIFPASSLVADTAAAGALVLDTLRAGTFDAIAHQARQFSGRYDLGAIVPLWSEALGIVSRRR